MFFLSYFVRSFISNMYKEGIRVWNCTVFSCVQVASLGFSPNLSALPYLFMFVIFFIYLP